MTHHQIARDGRTFQALEVTLPVAVDAPVVAMTGPAFTHKKIWARCRVTIPTVALQPQRYGTTKQGEQFMKYLAMRSGHFGVTAMLALGFVAGNASALEFELTIPAGTPEIFTIGLGETYPVAVDIRNVDDEAGIAHLLFSNTMDYQFGPGSPAQCGTPSGPFNGQWWYSMTLALGERVRCTFPLTRTGLGILSWAQIRIPTGRMEAAGEPIPEAIISPESYSNHRLGVFPDIGISTQLLSSAQLGATEAMVRISVTNPSGYDVPTLLASTFCSQDYYLPPTQRKYSLEADFAGACPHVELNECSDGFPHPLQGGAWRIQMPNVPAGSQASCLVRMRFPSPLQSSITDKLVTEQNVPLITSPPGSIDFQGFDLNSSNNTAPFGVMLALQVPAGTRIALWSLVLLLVVVAWRHLSLRKSKG